MHQNDELPFESLDQSAAYEESLSLDEFSRLIAQYKRAIYEKAYWWSQPTGAFQSNYLPN